MKENETEKEMPIGFLFKIAMDNNALNYYSTLNINTKNEITNYIQNSVSGDEAKKRIGNVIEHLKNNNLDFLGKES